MRPAESSLAMDLVAVIFFSMMMGASAKISATCKELYGSKPISFIFCADDGAFSGTHEAKYVLHNLKDAKNLTHLAPYCTSSLVGHLMGHKVVVTTTGIGPLQAAGCIQKVLGCADNVKEVLYMGTSGFPPALGGLLNTPNCSPTMKGRGEVTRLGDVCITTFAVNWDCKLADWSEQSQGWPNVCSEPIEEAGPTADTLFGKCLYTSAPRVSQQLAVEVTAAARSPDFLKHLPPRSDALKLYEAQYWNDTIQGTGVQYYTYPADDNSVNIWDNSICVELDSQFFFSGVPWDITSRNYTATTLNIAWNTSKYNVTNVIYSNAMEGIGLLQTLENYNSVATKKIPYTILRGASDLLYEPIARLPNNTWGYTNLEADFTSGYATAIQTVNTVLLTTFMHRCEVLSEHGHVDHKICDFTVA